METSNAIESNQMECSFEQGLCMYVTMGYQYHVVRRAGPFSKVQTPKILRRDVAACSTSRADVGVRTGRVSTFQNFKIPNSKNLHVEHIPSPTCVDLYGGSHTQNCAQTHTHTDTHTHRRSESETPHLQTPAARARM